MEATVYPRIGKIVSSIAFIFRLSLLCSNECIGEGEHISLLARLPKKSSGPKLSHEPTVRSSECQWMLTDGKRNEPNVTQANKHAPHASRARLHALLHGLRGYERQEFFRTESSSRGNKIEHRSRKVRKGCALTFVLTISSNNKQNEALCECLDPGATSTEFCY